MGPVWDGNEVWLITGGGALFAAFPYVYASVFSGFYLAFMLLLLTLIFRAVSIEFRSKQPMKWWRRGMGCHLLHQQSSGGPAHRRSHGERYQRHSSGCAGKLHRNIPQPAESLFRSSGADDGRPVLHARGNLPADENPGQPSGTNQETAQTLRHHLHCPDHPARGCHPAVCSARSGGLERSPGFTASPPWRSFPSRPSGSSSTGTVRAGPSSPPAPPWAA